MNTSTRWPATSGGTRKTVTTDPCATPGGGSCGLREAELRTRVIWSAAHGIGGPPMEITFVTTELAPFVKIGGLADVSAALPKALRALGHAITIVMPRYPALEEHGLLLARRLTPLRFTLGERTIEATVFDGRLASQVDLVVVDVPGLFDRASVYGERGEDYPDNALRFAAL